MQKAVVIDGKYIAGQITDELKAVISSAKRTREPGLATVLVGNDKASAIYVANKRRKAEEIGIASFHHQLNAETSETDILRLLTHLNNDSRVDAILVQLPLPAHVNEQRIIDAIDPTKDADGIHPLNLGYLLRGDPLVKPCTPQGIIHLMHSVKFDLMGRHAVIVGRSTIVGKPLAHLLLQEDATVTICHSKTKNLSAITQEADVLIAAVGRAKMINRSHVKPGVFIVDVGINRDNNNKLCGDVDFNDVLELASFITPVPFGVGPLTIAMLLKNTVTNFMRTLS